MLIYGGPYDGLVFERPIAANLGDHLTIPLDHDPGLAAFYQLLRREVTSTARDVYAYEGTAPDPSLTRAAR
ncbi:hypothetical protein [Streptomyces bauhiniae]|uniref:hypothetical protein n=1 Tax=Streptomyces bauhiniae TaxID=2340725 RepID=UPI0035D61962